MYKSCKYDGVVEKALFLHNRNHLRRMVLVSINRVDECINRADQRVTGGHASPPLRFVDTFSTVPYCVHWEYRLYQNQSA